MARVLIGLWVMLGAASAQPWRQTSPLGFHISVRCDGRYTPISFGSRERMNAELSRAAHHMVVKTLLCAPEISPDQAIALVQTVFDVEALTAMRKLAGGYADIGRSADAIMLWRRLLKANPDPIRAARYQGSIVYLLMQMRDPLRFPAFDRLHAMRSSVEGGGMVGSMLHRFAMRADPLLAEHAHRALAEVDGSSLHAYLLGELMAGQQRWSEAIAAYTLSISNRGPDMNVEANAVALLQAHKAQLEAKHGPLKGPWSP